MTVPPPINSVDSLKRAAAFELEHTAEALRRVIEEHAAAYRWLLASLLAVNGGAILFTKEHLDSAAGLFAGAIFVLGIMFALVTGWLGQRANGALVAPLREMSAFWISTVESGDFDKKLYEEIAQKEKVALKTASRTQVCGWISAIAFLVGVVVAGVAMLQELPTTTKAPSPEITNTPTSPPTQPKPAK